MSAEIYYERMCEQYAARAGERPDAASDAAIRLGILAGELESLELGMRALERDASPFTACGVALEGFAALRGIARREAAQARGQLRFTRGGSELEVSIPEGTVCLAQDGSAFVTTESVRIPAGEQTAYAAARAQLPGAASNARAGLVWTPARPVPGVVKVENPAAFYGGADAEGDDSLRARLLESFANPVNGANAAYYRALAERFEGIDSAAVIEDPIGSLTVAVAVPGETVVDEGLLTVLTAALEAARTPGISLTVRGAVATEVAVTAQVQAVAGASSEAVAQAAAERIAARLARMRVGEGLSRAELIRLLLTDPAVENFQLTDPAQDLQPGADALLRAGTIGVTAWI